MIIRSKIRSFLNNLPVIYDVNGSLITSDRFCDEYYAVRSFLYENCINSVVSIQLQKDYHYVICILACMDLGITYIPLSCDYPDPRVEQIKKISNFDIKIDYSKFIDIVSGGAWVGDIVFPNISNADVLYIMFTSGSTGMPKGVVIQRGAYENFLNWQNMEFNLSSQDVLLNSTEFTFDVSLVDVGFLLNFQPVVVFSNFKNDIFVLLNEIYKYHVTVIATVPNNFSMIFRDGVIDRVDISTLSTILVAGSRFHTNLYEQFQSYLPDCQVYNCYGPTEFTIYCLYKKMGDRDDVYNDVVSIGKPLLNTCAKIVDDSLSDVECNIKGELIVSGQQLMKEYINEDVHSGSVLVELDGVKYYRTGDLVFKTETGNYYMVGRLDDTVKVSGFRVNLSDVDSYIESIDGVNAAVTVFVEGNDYNGGILVCYVQLQNILVDNLRADLKSILPSFQVPKYLIVIDDFPINNSGKICKKTLVNKFIGSNRLLTSP